MAQVATIRGGWATVLVGLVLLASTRTAAAAPLGADDQRLLQRLVLAEAQGEGELGMALVARATLNRVALVRSGTLDPSTYNARGSNLRAVVFARNQYQPVSDGSLNRARSAADMAGAGRAIALAQDTAALRSALRARGLNDAAIDRLITATGFRGRGAYYDASQDYDRQGFRNHVFNRDRFSRRQNVQRLFARYYEGGAPAGGAAPRSRGLSGALRELDADDAGAAPDGESERGSAAPGSAAPGSAAPGSAAPGSAAPGSAAPGSAAPGSAAPGSAAPGSAAPAPAAQPAPAAPPRPSTPLARAVAERGPMKMGAMGDLVKAVQRKIGAMPTGFFGLPTKDALRAWQQAHGLRSTGEIDAATAEALAIAP
ncbi:MAG: peptidoglycan-binding protein [Planctomycetota bacterium]